MVEGDMEFMGIVNVKARNRVEAVSVLKNTLWDKDRFHIQEISKHGRSLGSGFDGISKTLWTHTCTLPHPGEPDSPVIDNACVVCGGFRVREAYNEHLHD